MSFPGGHRGERKTSSLYSGGRSSSSSSKLRSSSSNSQLQSNKISESSESPEVARLNQLGVSAYLQDVTTLLLENRPENPLEFIADYFRDAVRAQSEGSLARSYALIRKTDRSRTVFLENLYGAYITLDSAGKGLTGREYTCLLEAMCSDFPFKVLNQLPWIADKRSYELIDFASFRTGVLACLLFEEFFEQVEWLFKSLDSTSSGQIPREVVQQTFSLLQEKNKKANGTSSERFPFNEVKGLPDEKELNEALNDALPKGKLFFDYKSFVVSLFKATTLAANRKEV